MLRRCPLLLLICISTSAFAADARQVIPHAQDRPPGPALSPADAIKKMQVPPGFQVGFVASEPEIVNPIAMAFDERGRIWITESVEYPRMSAGPGRDRVKTLEDTDHDGKVDKVTVFVDGLNIPSGIAVGHGGVWVANAPDILFLQDTDGDGKADKREVVVTGFGRDDTHELPNSLNWGPDGWLYGLNGVFNPSVIRQGNKEFRFTCALFRIHPRTREFQVFCEGTSNPWGVAWDELGSAFVSACVIDHLWHLVETGYYHRQGGPYPPHTWKIESIVKHKHQKAAYCGIHYFDNDAWPAEFRSRLFMGNIHGNCVNVDTLTRDGSTYFAKPAPDFLTANDAWFMPVSQKTGPDGSLYVLDWYDRYHCYQDAGRDAPGIDRLKGRLYRVRYQGTPRAGQFDLAAESSGMLADKLERAPNDFIASTVVRLLNERRDPGIQERLERGVLADGKLETRLRFLFALIGAGQLDPEFHNSLLSSSEPAIRAWALRAAGDLRELPKKLLDSVKQASLGDDSPDVRLQAVIAAPKIAGLDAVTILVDALSKSGDDKLLPHIVWTNLHPLVETQGERIVTELRSKKVHELPGFAEFGPRLWERMLASQQANPAAISGLLQLMLEQSDRNPNAARAAIQLLAARVQTREIAGPRLEQIRALLHDAVARALAGKRDGPLFVDLALLAASWKEPAGVAAVRELLSATNDPVARAAAWNALVAAGESAAVIDSVKAILAARSSGEPVRRQALEALGRLDDPRVAEIVLESYPQLEPALQPAAIELLTQRAAWSKRLLAAMGAKQIPTAALNLGQVRKLSASPDAEVAALVRAEWGTVRDQRNPQRELVVAQMRRAIRRSPGDPKTGELTFKKLCAQCHKLHGEGIEVGPDLTHNGRSSFDQLLSNVFDPSLVIGSAYRSITVATTDGRVLTGLSVEDSPNRIQLKVQGGKIETIPRGEVDAVKTGELSMMPENVETQYTMQEVRDLFAFITYDKHPSDPTAKQLPGVRDVIARKSADPAQFAGMVGEVAPGFTVASVGRSGLELLAAHEGKRGVLRTRPAGSAEPCVLSGRFDVPAGKASRVLMHVAATRSGDWQLIVKANGDVLREQAVGTADESQPRWHEVSVDLSKHAGKNVLIELVNAAHVSPHDTALWHDVTVE